jgi:hypothetical protein
LQIERPFSSPRGEPTLPQPVKNPIVASVVDRIRSAVARQLGYSLDALANLLEVDAAAFRRLIEASEAPIADGFIIDVVSALVRELAIGPEWLLTGHYDPTLHRQALTLAEDRSPAGRAALREFVRERYARIKPANPRA